MKTTIRNEMRSRRKELFTPMAGELLAAKFIDNINLNANSIIAVYFPVKGEIDIMPLAKNLLAKGHRIALPCINGEQLIFREWNLEDKLIEGRFNISEPSLQCEILKPTHIVVPLLAFDDAKHRIGYGSGFYDRTLPHVNSLKIGVAYDGQKVDFIPADEFDVPLDFVVTEQAIY